MPKNRVIHRNCSRKIGSFDSPVVLNYADKADTTLVLVLALKKFTLKPLCIKALLVTTCIQQTNPYPHYIRIFEPI